MDSNFIEKLREEFPDLYRNRQHVSLGCGDGWNQIIWDLSEKLTAKMKEVNPEEQEDFFLASVMQIKEKFGGLRFYVGGAHTSYSDGFFDLIGEAEELSLKTCEGCGTTEDVERKGYPHWVKTLCPNCGPKFEEHKWRALYREPDNV